MSLVGWWKEFQEELPAGWERAELRVQFGSPETCDRAAALLAPAQPFRIDPMVLRFAASQNGTGPGPDAVTRLLDRLDQSRIRGHDQAGRNDGRAGARRRARTTSLAESWDTALAGLPPDWSDLYAELTLTSTAFVAPASVLCTPINLRLEGDGSVLRFRSAQTFGYGASPGMVRRCFERCDDARAHRLGDRAPRALRLAPGRHAGSRSGSSAARPSSWTTHSRSPRRCGSGEVTPVELVERSLREIERADPQLNAFVTVCGEQALETARGPLPPGPFTGVPIAIKDLTETAGIRTTFSSRAFADYVPEHDMAVVRRLKEAGIRDRRQDEHARVRRHGGHRVGAERHLPKPLGPLADARWLVGRRGRSRGGGPDSRRRTARTAAARFAFPPPAAASSA